MRSRVRIPYMHVQQKATIVSSARMSQHEYFVVCEREKERERIIISN